ncbi:secreted RxLR effector peptide protein, putative [Phytophthora infestans T30-4]|uniref:RxLR effector protein n=2 Tax=Phytophthora infestans TaxID=4787 RepID=D0NTF6_PHYIT|nr:secreted RxLR effector peptide protein, putative [Phytophthora infestans T30-4]EEY64907.1 secreted RxLR effector peptide protein, putative [Phytophthora infestans T30-4]KAF4046892.1 hypothetical protein GN244_ATG00615 [Phytophthora infestans]KAF4150078.1 hypothetical protein GN958_ATG00704 [Phytophthora infestans]|eukprot:XP_002897637.1 secreted RxLR effector peptide protein, putative [Phytophthora infestans T30-4]
MRVLYITLISTTAALLYSHAFALTTKANADTTQTTTDISSALLAGVQDKDLAMRALRTGRSSGGNVEHKDHDEERWLSRVTNWIKYKRGKMNPKQLHTYLGLDGLGQSARDSSNFQKYLKKSAEWRNKH